MYTLTMFLFIFAVLVNIFLFKKSESIWGRETAGMILLGTFVTPVFIWGGIGFDLGAFGSGSPMFLLLLGALYLGVPTIVSFVFSLFDNFDFSIPEINVSAPVKIIVDAIGFIASILGIISFFSGR